MNEKQREYLENLGFYVTEHNATMPHGMFEEVEILSSSKFGRKEIELEISTWSSSDKSIARAKKMMQELNKAIEIVETYQKLE